MVAQIPKEQAWLEAREYSSEQLALAERILEEIQAGKSVANAVRAHPLPEGGYIGKHVLVYVYRQLVEAGEWTADPELLQKIRMKPMRTLSGVTTVTVLTEPYPCPGRCIFCPDDARMPKSYLPDEPGAMRALHHAYDPYQQTAARLEALEAIGHPTDKIELLILGGTWSAYPSKYQEWFIKRCLDAMNAEESEDLVQAQRKNENSPHKNVGLVIETRPDQINQDEILRLRYLGVTKVQMGAQSLDDRILELNDRGHSVQDTRGAMRLLRAVGLKLVLHWMPNLLGASLDSDRADFLRLWNDAELRPDEIKIYPCQLLEETRLYDHWKRGEYRPYTTDELINLIADLKIHIPRYCRVNRIVRDIPSDNVVEGNKRTSLRQDVQQEMNRRGMNCQCIRCREVGGRKVDLDKLTLNIQKYVAGAAEEHFISFMTETNHIAGYLRLSLPQARAADLSTLGIQDAALIREVHIYGQSLELGSDQKGAAQHKGLGTELMEHAEVLARQADFDRIAVIAALGTRGYYRKLGYQLSGTYMVKDLSTTV
jgi:elongator complex protein 3